MKKLIIYSSAVVMFMISSASIAHAQHKISSQGQGAIIGGAGGAVVGGIVGHGVGGALIGGAIGAGGGYIIGNEHRRHAEKERAIAYRREYYRKHHHYPNAYVYQKK
ncbi:MAG: hypothetical protein ACXVAY_13655 [Mucilaginibacter sp.]